MPMAVSILPQCGSKADPSDAFQLTGHRHNNLALRWHHARLVATGSVVPTSRTLAVQIQVMIAPMRPVTAPPIAPAAEILFHVMQKAIGGTALPTTTPMKRYTQPRERPIFLQAHHTEAQPSTVSTWSKLGVIFTGVACHRHTRHAHLHVECPQCGTWGCANNRQCCTGSSSNIQGNSWA